MTYLLRISCNVNNKESEDRFDPIRSDRQTSNGNYLDLLHSSQSTGEQLVAFSVVP